MSERRRLPVAIAAVLAGLSASYARAGILSTKRGMGDSGASYGGLQNSGAGWYYTWGTGAANPGGFNATFDPMFWNGPSQTTINNTLATNPQYILGFNEPERSDQANMSVQTAISSWTTISNSTVAYNSAHGTSIKLVSPAVADTGGATGGQQWLSSFMSQANSSGLKVDAVAFHWYDISTPTDPAGAASNFESRVSSYHSSYNLPVFITEFAIHDWGGTYPVSQMIDANRQFLNIVVPWMESQSYVAGYAWYNWFGDSALYVNNVPTPMGYTYIGAVGSGNTSDVGGIDLGEHVAYLSGGTLTMTGSAGTVKYINALAGTSTITGAIDWGLNPAATNNWVRVQPGATLVKNGTNTITFSGGSVTDHGVIQVAQGVLRMGASTGGAGSILISSDGGATGSTARLELTGGIAVNNPITFAQRNDPGGSDGIRNVSGNNAINAPVTITTGGNQARVQSDAGLITINGNITTDATSARNFYMQGAGNGAVYGAISNNAGNVNGTINVTKQGAGTWTLAGANTYTGTTTVSAGTLGFASAPSNVGSVNVADGATLRVQAFAPAGTTLTSSGLTLGTASSSSLSLDLNGLDRTGPLIFTGVLTANGTVNVSLLNSGAVLPGSHALIAYTSFAGGGTFSGSPFTLGPRTSGTLVNNGANAVLLNVTGDRPVWSGGDSGNWVVGSTGANGNWKLQTAATATDYIEGDNVLFDDSATGPTAVTINTASVSPAALVFNNSAKNYTITSGGGFGIAGGASLTKNGTGTLTISTANSFSGPVVVNGGTLYANVSGNPQFNAGFSNVSGIAVNSGGTLKAGANSLFGWSGVNDKPITVNGGGTLTTDTQGDVGVGLVILNGGTMTTGGANAGAGTWRFQDPTSKLLATDNSSVTGVNYKFQNGASIDVATGKVLTFSGTITDTTSFGASSLVKSGGSGILTLSGTNNYSGGTSISAGTVSISANNNLGSNASPVVINGATLRTTNTTALTSTHPITIGSAGATLSIVGNGVGTTSQGDRVIFNTANTLFGSGALTVNGNGTLAGAAPNTTTAGAGALVLTAPNSYYTGNLTLQNGGLLEYSAADALPFNGQVTLGNEAEFSVANGLTTYNNIVVSGGTNSVISFNNATTGTHAGAITLNANAVIGLRDWYNYATVRGGTISGVISGVGGITVNSGTGTGGTLTLTGLNTFTGGITINNATVAAGTAISGTPAGQIASNLGDLVASGRTITVNSGGVLSLTSGNVLGTGGSTNTLSGLTLVVNQGGVFQTGLNTTGSGWWNKIGNLTLNGGAVHVGTGANSTNFQGLALIGTVTVGGSAPSTIDNFVGSDSTANGIHLGQNSTAGQSVTFNVADATGDANSDLTVSARLLNTSSNLVASGLTKTGVGTMQLNAVNGYTGTTIVNGGMLKLAGGSSTGVTSADVQIANATGTSGTLDVEAGATLNAQRVIVAGNSANTTGGTGTLIQNGGTLNAAQWFTVGSEGPGTYTLNNGTLNQNSAGGTQLEVGAFGAVAGASTMTVNGGAINLLNNASLAVGAQGTAQNATVTQNGGTITFYSNAGTTVGGSGAVVLGSSANPTGTYTYNLNGGTLTTPKVTRAITSGPGVGVFNFNGGTLQAAAGTATFVSNLSSAVVKSGGAIVDTNGFTDTIRQALTHDAGLGATVDGGLTKNGAGTLTLTGASTYTGPTTVNAGTLQVGAGGSLASVTNVSANGGTARFSGGGIQTIGALSGNAAGVVTVDSGSTLSITGGGTFAGTLNANGAVNVPGNASTSTPATRTLGTLNVPAGGSVKLGASAAPLTPLTLQVGSSLTDGGTIDLTNNILIAPGLAGTAEGLITGGNAITTTAGLALGYGDAGGGNFEVRATLLGDTNLDGSVDVTDLGNLASSYGAASGALWVQGDSNYDGAVDVTDLGNLASNYGGALASGPAVGAAGGAAGAMDAVSTARLASGATAEVPEPGTLALLGLAAIAVSARRSRRSPRLGCTRSTV